MDLDFRNKTIDKYNQLKQKYYLEGDIYLCLSRVEGASYSTIDAMINNLLIVSTNVGIMENEVSKDSFVSIDWTNMDINLISNKINYIWENKEYYLNKSREEYFKLISWNKWEKKWNYAINELFKNLQKDYKILN